MGADQRGTWILITSVLRLHVPPARPPPQPYRAGRPEQRRTHFGLPRINTGHEKYQSIAPTSWRGLLPSASSLGVARYREQSHPLPRHCEICAEALIQPNGVPSSESTRNMTDIPLRDIAAWA